jgi:hypothetical protein
VVPDISEKPDTSILRVVVLKMETISTFETFGINKITQYRNTLLLEQLDVKVRPQPNVTNCSFGGRLSCLGADLDLAVSPA